MADITFTLNGERITLREEPNLRFLDVLREKLNHTGAKEGCGEGECGACAILLDGHIVNSCLLPLASVDGRDVVTIEGYRVTERYQMLEKAFIEEGAVQCGICTPGMMIAAESMLRENPDPTDEEIRHGLAGNLCRCTGYNMIIAAIRRAAKEGEGLW